ncbi:hypothetical protein BH10CYA1_BH10CYA1_49230 [soil metagenome]
MRPIYFLTWLAAFLLAQPNCRAEVKTLASGNYTAKDMRIQQFVGKISLDQVDNGTPLTLNFTNGRFAWVRVFLTDSSNMNPDPKAQPRGMMIVNEGSFKRTSQVALDFTGRLRQGTSVLLIRGAGMPGSTFGWTLTTVTGTKITHVEPSNVQVGGRITLTGGPFSTDVAQNVVMFNNTKAKIVDATTDSVKAMVPDALTAGTYTITVTSSGSKSNPVSVKLKGAPEVTGTSLNCVKSTSTFNIYGKNFSEVLNENEVKIGSEAAKVTGATAESLTVEVPMFPDAGGGLWFNPPLQKPMTVKVGNVMAKGNLSIYIGPYPW